MSMDDNPFRLCPGFTDIVVMGDSDVLMDHPDLCIAGSVVTIKRIDAFNSARFYSYVHDGIKWNHI